MRFVALIRAVNVGGTGKLPMTELQAICRQAGYGAVETYIASGNVVFESRLPVAVVQAELERRLQAYAGKPVGVLLRTAAEMRAVLAGNPFPKSPPNLVYVFFLADRPARTALGDVAGRKTEQLRLGKREIYAYYPDGMGQSKLRIPAAKAGTARNMNTVARLAEMATAAGS